MNTTAKRITIPRTRARTTEPCRLCDYKIKQGQRVGMDFRTKEWSHLGCVIRLINKRNVEELAALDETEGLACEADTSAGDGNDGEPA